MSDVLSQLLALFATQRGASPYGNQRFGGNTFGGAQFGGNKFGGNTFGVSRPTENAAVQPPPVMVRAAPPQLPAFDAPGGTADQYMPFSGYPRQAPAPRQTSGGVAQAPVAPQPPLAQPEMPPPVSMEMQGVAPFGGMPKIGRNELERDYYAQFAANPNGFGTGWLGRLFGA